MWRVVERWSGVTLTPPSLVCSTPARLSSNPRVQGRRPRAKRISRAQTERRSPPLLVPDTLAAVGGIDVGVQQVCAAVETDALVGQSLLERTSHVLVRAAHDLRPALEDRDLGAETGELVGGFEADGPRAQDDERLGVGFEFEGLVAGEVARFRQAGEIDIGDVRTGGDEEAARLDAGRDRAGVGGIFRRQDVDVVGVDETGQTPDEIELAVLQLAAPVTGKFPHQPAFAGLDLSGHDGDVFRPQAELARPAQSHETVGGFDHRLARHAAAQDAEAADVPPRPRRARFSGPARRRSGQPSNRRSRRR